MPSVGELFIQLAVMGNANELKKANAEMQKANVLTQKQNKLDKLRAEYLERIQKAQDKQQKRELAQQYKVKKANIEKEAGVKLQNIEAKMLKSNITQWSTYAHAVSMASSIAVSSLKKVYSELDKVMNYGLTMTNIGMTTSSSIGSLQGYGRVAKALNPNLSETGVMQQLAKINQAYDMLKAGFTDEVVGLLAPEFFGLSPKAGAFAGRVMNPKSGIKTGEEFLEGLREVIAGESPERQVNILRKAGLDEGLLPLLRLSKEEFDAKKKESMRYALTEQQLQEQAKTAEAINNFKQHFQDFVQNIFGTFTPILESLVSSVEQRLPAIFNQVKVFSDKIRENMPTIKSKIEEIAKFVFDGELVTVLKQLGHIISKIAGFLGFKEDVPLTYSPDTGFSFAKGFNPTAQQQKDLDLLNSRFSNPLIGTNAFSANYGSLTGVDFQSVYAKGLRDFNANPVSDANAGFMSPIQVENLNLYSSPANQKQLAEDLQRQYECGAY